MDNLVVWISICIISILWGSLHYRANYYKDIEKENSYYKFLEFFRFCLNYFITLVIVYYFVSLRWNVIVQIGGISASDFILAGLFLVGVFGWFPYFVKNITQGINAIITKILN